MKKVIIIVMLCGILILPQCKFLKDADNYIGNIGKKEVDTSLILGNWQIMSKKQSSYSQNIIENKNKFTYPYFLIYNNNTTILGDHSANTEFSDFPIYDKTLNLDYSTDIGFKEAFGIKLSDLDNDTTLKCIITLKFKDKISIAKDSVQYTPKLNQKYLYYFIIFNDNKVFMWYYSQVYALKRVYQIKD